MDSSLDNPSSDKSGRQSTHDLIVNSYSDNSNDCSSKSFISGADSSTECEAMDPAKRLNEIKTKNPRNPSLTYININSIRYKHNDLFTMAQNNIDILAIAETKLDSSFPSAQFLVHGYRTPYRKDGSKHGGGLLGYVKEDISCCQLTNQSPVHNLFDIIAVELNFWRQTWLLIAVYKSPSVSDTALFEQMSNVIDYYLQKYQTIVLIGDFNIEPADKKFKAFCESHEFYNLIKSKTCFRSGSSTYMYRPYSH